MNPCRHVTSCSHLSDIQLISCHHDNGLAHHRSPPVRWFQRDLRVDPLCPASQQACARGQRVCPLRARNLCRQHQHHRWVSGSSRFLAHAVWSERFKCRNEYGSKSRLNSTFDSLRAVHCCNEHFFLIYHCTAFFFVFFCHRAQASTAEQGQQPHCWCVGCQSNQDWHQLPGEMPGQVCISPFHVTKRCPSQSVVRGLPLVARKRITAQVWFSCIWLQSSFNLFVYFFKYIFELIFAIQ